MLNNSRHRVWLAYVAATVISLATGCYKPDVKDGGLMCAFGESSVCPDSFECRADGRCWEEDSCFEFTECNSSVATGDTCDPVCQSGCDCDEACVWSSAGARCDAAIGNDELGESCSVGSCQPGLLCLQEAREACGFNCVRHCRTDADCGGRGYCSGTVAGEAQQKFCDFTATECDPVGQNAPCSPNEPNFGCYILGSNHPDETGCQCAGTKALGALCDYEVSDCAPGLVCVGLQENAVTVNRCRQVCELGGSDECAGLGRCEPYFGSDLWGFCDGGI